MIVYVLVGRYLKVADFVSLFMFFYAHSSLDGKGPQSLSHLYFISLICYVIYLL